MSCPCCWKTFAEVVELAASGCRRAVDGRQRRGRRLLARKLVGLLVVEAAAPRDSPRRRSSGGSSVRQRSSASAQRSAKTQPGDLGPEARQEARDRVEPAVVLADAAARDAAQQADRVRVARVLEDRLDRALLDEPAGVEHADAVAHLRDHAEVVADEEHRRVELGLQVRDEIEHLGLDRRVEAGRRLVEDQQRRVLGERHRDHDALLHPARELVRVAAHHRAGVGDLHARERLARALLGLLARRRRAR